MGGEQKKSSGFTIADMFVLIAGILSAIGTAVINFTTMFRKSNSATPPRRLDEKYSSIPEVPPVDSGQLNPC